MLEVHLLGTFEVKYQKKPITISSRAAQTLFAYLILSAETSHRREKLAGMLWPDSLEETARDNLRHALWRMRKALEAASSTRFLHADDVTISFKESPDYWLDAAELEKLSENSSGDELMAALSEYQGELLPGFYDEWVVLEREHLQSIFEHHMARLMSLLQTEKRWLDILDWGERWIRLGQKPEPAYRALMRSPSQRGIRPHDGPDVLNPDGIEFFTEAYLPGRTESERRDPAVSPLYANLRGMPPALMSVGTCDHLADDTLMLAARWAAVGNAVELFVAPEMPHGFMAYPCALTDAWIARTHEWMGEILARA